MCFSIMWPRVTEYATIGKRCEWVSHSMRLKKLEQTILDITCNSAYWIFNDVITKKRKLDNRETNRKYSIYWGLLDECPTFEMFFKKTFEKIDIKSCLGLFYISLIFLKIKIDGTVIDSMSSIIRVIFTLNSIKQVNILCLLTGCQ